MAEPKKTSTTPKSTKKAAPKKAAATPENEVMARLNALEERIELLEDHDVVKNAECAGKNMWQKLQQQYEANPTATIGIGIVILLVLTLIF